MKIEYNTTQETQETLGNDLAGGPGQANERPQPLIIQPITSSQIYTKDMVDQRMAYLQNENFQEVVLVERDDIEK